MKIDVKDLRIGDEFLYAKNGDIVYAKVLSHPRQSKTKKHWVTKLPLYTNVKCKVAGIIKEGVFPDGRKWIQRTTSNDPNDLLNGYEQRLDLNRNLWLIKREEL